MVIFKTDIPRDRAAMNVVLQQREGTMVTPESKTLENVKAAGLIPASSMKTQIASMFDKNRKGFEEQIQPGELTIPRVKMLQGLSPEVQENPKTFYAGLLINSITKEMLTETFIPIRRMPNSWVRFNPRDSKAVGSVPDVKPGAVVWKSNDPKDPRVIEDTKFGPNGEAPLATSFLNFLCYFEGFTLPLLLSFGRTSYQPGKDFLTMAFGFGGDMYSRKYKLVAKQVTNDKGTFYVLNVTPAGKVSEDEMAIGATLFDAFGGEVKVHEEEEHETA